MEKMISPNGVEAYMCCASCLYSDYHVSAGFNIKRWCKKKDRPILSYGKKCGYYAMAKFFQERGYKPINN